MVKDRTGHVYGMLRVLSRAENTKDGKARWRCICSCGAEIIAQSDNLQTGRTRSCGHVALEKLREYQSITHGMTDTPTYRSWTAMIYRCYAKDNPRVYKDYGGRGIFVCDQWLKSFDQFYLDMGDRPDGCTLDRIDSNKGYYPENCRWATVEQQANNKRNNVFIEHDGQVLSLTQWSRLLGGNENLVAMRLRYGWDKEKAVSTPVRKTISNKEQKK
jgi:hypothetical protein